MSDDLLYNLTITVESNADIENVEDKLEQLLFDLYDEASVEEIMVKDRTPPIDEDMDELLDVIEALDSDDVKQAANLVRELETIENE